MSNLRAEVRFWIDLYVDLSEGSPIQAEKARKDQQK